ncbi:MAG: hypothetical protein K5899_02930 [Bacteroidaceae bacterium]|nr:hypothetical protein [Bacteroidaceae bacterium]
MNKFVYNSIAVERRNNYKEIDLFAGCGGLNEAMKSTWKYATIRVSKSSYGSLWKDNPCLSQLSEVFFANWELELNNIPRGEQFQIKADLNLLCRIGRYEMIQKIVRYFRGMGFPVCRDFIGRIEVWIPTDEGNAILYNRYTLRPYYQDITDGWQIDVSHSGESRCSKKTLYEVDLDDHGFDVIAGTEVLRRKQVKQYHFQKYDGGCPVINKYTKSVLNLSEPHSYDKNKYATKMKKIKNFIQTYLNTQQFQDALDINILNNGELIQVKSEDILMVDEKARNLKYGDGFVGSLPRNDFSQHGPYIQPQPFKYFFVSLNSEKSNIARNRLYNILQIGRDTSILHQGEQEHGTNKTFRRLGEYLTQPLSWVPKLSLAYSSYDTALKELHQHLMDNSRFVPGYNYIAIIISEIHKDTQDSHLHELYYRMKELLMKSKITSQVIYAPNINNSHFEWFLPNIAAAITGKQNGMAWGLESLSQRNDMIVGIGASKQHGRKPYLGTAFCFDKEGQFREFDCCQAEDTEALGASLKKALWKFCKQYGKPERLIIHYYKKLRRDESEQIEMMLKQNELQCPVYVVNMVTAVNDDLIAFDTSKSDYMPKSGTYVHLRDTQFLLYNNERYSDNGKVDILFPIKLTITSANTNTGGVLTKEDATDIITQVYQFCRLYWKSVKMQNVPITIAYPGLVAQYVPHFDDENLPEFGKHNLWML